MKAKLVRFGMLALPIVVFVLSAAQGYQIKH